MRRAIAIIIIALLAIGCRTGQRIDVNINGSDNRVRLERVDATQDAAKSLEDLLNPAASTAVGAATSAGAVDQGRE